jgi:hypothetical protein
MLNLLYEFDFSIQNVRVSSINPRERITAAVKYCTQPKRAKTHVRPAVVVSTFLVK